MEKEDEKIMLLKALSLGDKNAFRTLFLNYFPKVKRFITHILKNEVIAEDLSQEIFIKVWESKETLPAIRSFDAYIYRMAKNAAINQIKRELYHNDYIKHETARPEDFSLEEEFFAKEICLLIDLTVTKMPDKRRQIYTMSRVEGLKNDEIAEKLHISKKTVENHLNTALKEIRKSISFMLSFFI